MALEIKAECERCDRPLDAGAESDIPTYECTFPPDCTTAMDSICQNCGGELVGRPRPPT